MSVAYQRWEIGGASSMRSYNKITGSPQVHQYGSEGVAVLRRQQQQQHPHELCNLSSSFSMFAQQCPGAAATTTTTTTTTTAGDTNRIHIPATVKASSSSSSLLSSPQQPQAALSVHWETQADASSKQAMPNTVSSTLSLSNPQDKRTEGEQRWGIMNGNTHKPETTRPLNGTAQYYNGAQVGTGLSLMMKPANKEATAEECSSPALQKAESTRLVNVLPESVHQCLNLEPSCSPSSSSSSSICDRRDQQSCCSSEEETCGDGEAQSAYSGPLNQMSALESSLPIKRPGLSKFFGGKSRSFSSLADVTSVSDLAKPNNPYPKRRRMMGSGSLSASLDRQRSYPPISRTSVAGISKKPITNRSSSSLTIAVKLGGLTREDKDAAVADANRPGSSFRSGLTRTTPSRSFSLTDLRIASNPSPFPPFQKGFARP